MNVPQEDLNELAGHVEAIRIATSRASAYIRDEQPLLAQGQLIQLILERIPNAQMKLQAAGALISEQDIFPQCMSMGLLKSATNEFLISLLQNALLEASHIGENGGSNAGTVQMLEALVAKVHLEMSGTNSLK